MAAPCIFSSFITQPVLFLPIQFQGPSSLSPCPRMPPFQPHQLPRLPLCFINCNNPLHTPPRALYYLEVAFLSHISFKPLRDDWEEALSGQRLVLAFGR